MASRPRYPRSTCCVPFCARWSTLFRGEWMCRRHWLLVDPSLRRYFKRRLRALIEAYEVAEAGVTSMTSPIRMLGTPQDNAYLVATKDCGRAAAKFWRVQRLLWGRIKRQALEREAALR